VWNEKRLLKKLDEVEKWVILAQLNMF
jgi:hypothetical protein